MSEQPRLPFKVHPAAGNTPAEIEYEAEVSTPAGVKRQPFRIREGDRIFAPIMTLLRMYAEAQARLAAPADVEAVARAAVREAEKAPRKGK